VQPCQGWCRGFESLHPLHSKSRGSRALKGSAGFL